MAGVNVDHVATSRSPFIMGITGLVLREKNWFICRLIIIHNICPCDLVFDHLLVCNCTVYQRTGSTCTHTFPQ